MGGDNHIKCGVIGDCVNLASRVESLTRSYAIPLLTTDHSRARLQAPDFFAMRMVDRVIVQGRHEPVTLYEVFDADDPRSREAKLRVALTYERALEHYYERDFEQAEKELLACQEVLRDDPVVALHLARCAAHRRDPPPPSWIGVVELDHK
ncbi:MAG: hypothetical protein U0166_22700 [Acidobacteriota bacterium]